MSDSPNAFLALANLATKSRQSAHPLPAQIDAVTQWSGVGFSLFGKKFVVSMGDLSEMLEVPGFTKLPAVQSWVRGVANVRGRLLPVFDLAAYFGGHLSGGKKQQRLLVVDRHQVYAGLWVDQVFGMQYFPANERLPDLPVELPATMEPYIEGGFSVEGQHWFVFHPLRLLEDQQFMDVAVG